MRAEMERHIGWDIGVADLGRRLADRLDACFIEQRYSRLVIDCNRAPDRADAMPAISDGTVVPGNAGLDDAARAERVAAIHAPYQAAIAQMLADRDAAGRETVIVSLHSFTPVLAGQVRPWDVGVLYDGGDTRFARDLLARLEEWPGLIVGDNAPYQMDDTDYTVPTHAYSASRAYAELEVRQDHLATAQGRESWAALLMETLTDALEGAR